MAAKSRLKAALANIPVAALFPPRQGSLLAPDPAAPTRRGRGRPKGARNRATLAAEALVEDFGGAIIAEKARLALMTPIAIAREWLEEMTSEELADLRARNIVKGRTPVDLIELAIRVKENAGTDVLPFLKPKKLHVEGEGGFMQLSINLGSAPAAPGAAPPAPAGPLADIFPPSQQNQEVIEGKALPSDVRESDASEKGEPDQ